MRKNEMHIGCGQPTSLRLRNEPLALLRREGIVIWTVACDNDDARRPIFYRMPFSRVAARYDSSKYPYPRELAFDTWVQTSLLTINIQETMI